MTGAEIAIGKAFFDVFKWAWKEFPAKSVWRKFQFKSAAEAYAKNMKKRYGQMQLWTMSAPTSVEKIFTQVNVLKKQSAFRNIPKAQLEAIYLNQAGFGEVTEKGKDGMAAVKDADRLFILGKPGAGKTTFLKHITLEAIKGRFEAIPIFITLLDLSKSKQSLMDFLVKQFKICGFPKAEDFIKSILDQGRAIVLFDGLDEVNREGGLRDTVIQEIKDFSEEYRQSRVVITCRVAASEYLFEGFTIVEMADFDEAQIKIFITKWFVEDPQKSKSFFIEFEKHEGDRLRELAKSPLLLTLLCLSFEENTQFPNRRSKIYDEALDVLLKKRDRSRGIERDPIYDKLSPGQKKEMFALIAYETFEKGNYLLEKGVLEKKIVQYLQSLTSTDTQDEIDGEAVLKAIESQHGIFVERSKGVYSFAHLSFQEYYAAHYTIYTISGSENRLSRLMPFAFDPPWREVFLLGVEMLDDAVEFFEFFIEKLNEFATKHKHVESMLIHLESGGKESRTKKTFLELRNKKVIHVLIVALGLKRIRTISYRKEPDLARGLANEFIYLLSVALDYEGSHIRAHSLDHAISFARDLMNFHSFNFSLDTKNIRRDYTKLIALSKSMRFLPCHHSLIALSIPSEKATDVEWQDFVDQLRKIFCATFSVDTYCFKREEASQVIKYLEATKLLLDCLKVAYVSDRDAIKDRLLRPVN